MGAHLGRSYLKTESEFNLPKVVFLNKNRTMDNVQKHNIYKRKHILTCLATGDAGQIVNWFIYNLHVRNYNHLFHSNTFTQFTNTTL
jgi:hypothetical protein